MPGQLPRTVVHFGKDDPLRKVGGVATFARNLELVFEHVVFMTPGNTDFDWVRRDKLPVICDNHFVLQVPDDLPAIGFQHGVAAEKFSVTRSLADLRLAMKQRRAAGRPRTLWVACADWIAKGFAARYGNGAQHVIYHQVDLERFDGRRPKNESRLVLHDARNPHKGIRQVARLKKALTEYDFQALTCTPAEVPERMRRALAFIHLSRYEGNSIVCNEAMAQNLPCLLTRVGLFRDDDAPRDVWVLDTQRAFKEADWLEQQTRQFLQGLSTRSYAPRRWVEEHASLTAVRARWAAALQDLDALWEMATAPS